MSRRKRWMRQPLSWQRGGAAALAALSLVVIAALIVDAGAGADVEAVAEYLDSRGRPPAELVAEVGRGARWVLLSDIPELAEPKRVAAAAIRALAAGPGLDAVVLEVPSSEQPYIDAYLNAIEEDATAILSRPAAVQEDRGVARAYLEIYRSVWRMNREVGAARRIRIIAADLPDWPPPMGASPTTAARSYARRAEHMIERMDEELLARIPDARLLIFIDGYMTLQRTHGEARFAGGEPVRVGWLGERLRDRAPHDVRTVLIDAGAGAPGVRTRPAYHGTAFHRPLARALDRDAGVRIDETFSLRDPVLETSSPGFRLEIRPLGYRLRDVADGYIFLR